MCHTDNLSSTLQNSPLPAAERQAVAAMTTAMLSYCGRSSGSIAEEQDVEELKRPLKVKVPAEFQIFLSSH